MKSRIWQSGLTVWAWSSLLIGATQGNEFHDAPASMVQVAEREDCFKYEREVQPSDISKTWKFQQFGLSVQAPDNYRTILLNDGSVLIVSPAEYDFITCVARGGRGGRGHTFSPLITSHTNPKKLSLQNFLLERKSIEESKRGRYSIRSYVTTEVKGELTTLRPYRGPAVTSFFMEVPGIDNIVEISAACDCNLEAEDITSIVKKVTLLQNGQD